MSKNTLSRRQFLRLSASVIGSVAVMSTSPRLLNKLAATPQTAAWLETAQNEKPDLILLDLFMPKIKGFEVCKHLKERSETGISSGW